VYYPIPWKDDPEWVEIPGYSQYVAHSDGFIQHKRLGHRTQGGVAGRYRRVSVYPDGSSTAKLAYTHHLICRAFYGPPQPGQVVLHLDNDRLNVSASNLRWGSQQENIQQMWDDGLRSSQEHYQEEEDSTITHNGQVYRLNPILTIAQRQQPILIEIDQLTWNLEHAHVDQARYDEANPAYPIVVMPTQHWGWVVLDGTHRLAKAFDQGDRRIPAYSVRPKDIEPFRLTTPSMAFASTQS
jgi:hypothetical protein